MSPSGLDDVPSPNVDPGDLDRVTGADRASDQPLASGIPHCSSPNGRAVAKGSIMAAPGPVFVYAPVTNNISNTTHQGAPSPLRSKLEQVYWVAGILGVIVAIVIAVLAYVRPPKLTDGRPSDVHVMPPALDAARRPTES
jgi:hypothetical protein